jgi:hypothetical protein
MAIRRCEPEPSQSYFDLVRQICWINQRLKGTGGRKQIAYGRP